MQLVTNRIKLSKIQWNLLSKVTLATKKLLKMLEQSVIRCNGYGETFLYAETIGLLPKLKSAKVRLNVNYRSVL